MKKIKIILFFTFIIIFIFSIFNILKWNNNNIKTKKQLEELYNNITINDTYEDDEKLLNVDFDNLKFINNSIVGWINMNNTKINYPFVQYNNNEYYLDHSFDKTYNQAGWPFLDYRNDKNNFNNNNIIYAHNRLDKTMFGSLKNVLKDNWYDDINNHFINISTDYQNSLWQIFSIYIIETTNDYLQIDFNDNEFISFINLLTNRSIYNFNIKVKEKDKIITLSTCHGKNKKLVIHAKLIKIQEKEKN